MVKIEELTEKHWQQVAEIYKDGIQTKNDFRVIGKREKIVQ